MRAAKVQASLRIRAVSPEPSLLAHTSSESRGIFRQKARSLAPLNGWACAVKICHDGMLEDTNSLDGAHLMDEHHSRYNESVWHKDWPHHVYIAQWPIFYGPVILLHILKTTWWRNIVCMIMDQCYTKIDLVKHICESVTYISWYNDFALYFVIDLKYFYILRNDTGRGYSCPCGHLL